MSLSAYFGVFEAQKTSTPSQSGLVKESVRVLQSMLHELGWPKTKGSTDGLYGPGIREEWQKLAISRRLNPAFDRAGPREAWINPQTSAAFLAEADRRGAPAPAPTPVAPTGGRLIPFVVIPEEQPTAPERLVNRPVEEVQEILKGIGYRLNIDKKYGSTTKRFWEAAATRRKLNPLFKKVTSTKVTVPMDTWMRLKAAAGMKAKKYVPGTVIEKAATLQAILYGLGFSKKVIDPDGKYGPKTKGAWEKSAAQRGLDQRFDKISIENVRISQDTYDRLATEAKAPVPVPVPAPIPTPDPVIEPPAPGSVKKAVIELQKILRGIGWRARTIALDEKYSPKVVKAWKKSSEDRGLDGRMWRVGSKTALVMGETFTRLKTEVAKKRKKEPKKKERPVPDTASLDVKTVQAGLNGKGTKPLVDVDGSWGKLTDNALVSWLRTQPGGEDAEYKVSQGRVTLPRMFALSLQEAAKGAPTPPPRVKILVSVIKKALTVIGKPVGVGSKLDDVSKTSLNTFIREIDFGVNTGYRVSKDKRTVTKLRKNVADKLEEIAKGARPAPEPQPKPTPKPAPKPEPKPAPKPDLIKEEAKKLAEPQQTIVSVLAVQQAILATEVLLKKVPPTVKATGMWDEVTQNGYLKYIAGAQKRHIPIWIAAFPLLLSVDRMKLRTMDNWARAINTLAAQYQKHITKPLPAPAPPKEDKLSNQIKRILKSATEKVKIKTLQQALFYSEYPVKITGKWDKATRAGLLDVLKYGPGQRMKKALVKALSKLVSDNRKSIMLPPSEAKRIKRSARDYLISIKKKETPSAPEPIPEPAPVPVVSPIAKQAWVELINSLKISEAYGPKIITAVKKANSTTGLTGTAQSTYLSWAEAGQRVFKRMAQLIEENPDVQEALNAAAPTAGFSGVCGNDELSAYFADVVTASSRVVAVLKQPFSYENLTQPVWRQISMAVSSPVVGKVGPLAVVKQGLSQIIKSEADSFQEYNQKILGLISSGKLSPEIEKPVPAPPITPTPPAPESKYDEYGCKPSAGQSWCSSLQRCIQPYKEDCPPVIRPAPPPPPPAPPPYRPAPMPMPMPYPVPAPPPIIIPSPAPAPAPITITVPESEGIGVVPILLGVVAVGAVAAILSQKE